MNSSHRQWPRQVSLMTKCQIVSDRRSGSKGSQLQPSGSLQAGWKPGKATAEKNSSSMAVWNLLSAKRKGEVMQHFPRLSLLPMWQ